MIVGLIIGLFIGGFFGVMVMALCVASSDADGNWRYRDDSKDSDS